MMWIVETTALSIEVKAHILFAEVLDDLGRRQASGLLRRERHDHVDDSG